MCNRFCPFMPCADPPEKEDVIHGSLVNPLSEEENKSSLFGRNKELNTVVKPKSLAAIKKPGAPASPGMTAREAPPEDGAWRARGEPPLRATAAPPATPAHDHQSPPPRLSPALARRRGAR